MWFTRRLGSDVYTARKPSPSYADDLSLSLLMMQIRVSFMLYHRRIFIDSTIDDIGIGGHPRGDMINYFHCIKKTHFKFLMISQLLSIHDRSLHLCDT